MSFQRTGTQALTEGVMVRIRMRCNPAYFLQLDSIIEMLGSDQKKAEARALLIDLHHRMKSDDGIHAKL